MPRTAKLPPGLWKRGGIYYARFTHNGQTVRKRLSSDLTVAKRALNDLRARADAGDFGLVSNDYPFADLKAEFLRWAKQATRNAGDYERDLKRFESYAKVQSVQQITASYVDGYREWRLSQRVGAIAGKEWEKATGRTVSPRTVNREVGTLHNMLNLGVRRILIGVNPLLGMKPLPAGEARKERRALSVAEVEAIFREAPEYLRTILRLFCSTGLRRNELTELRFSDVDFERQCITIRASIAKSKSPAKCR
jgi:integrase